MSIIPYLFSGSALSAAGAFALFAVLGFLGIANMRGGYPALMIAGCVIALFLFGMNWWNSAKQDLENAELKDDIRDIKKVVVGVTIQNNANVIDPKRMTIKNCSRCGGDHYGSTACPYIELPCVVCGKATVMACADCSIESGGEKSVHVCSGRKCQDEHERLNPQHPKTGYGENYGRKVEVTPWPKPATDQERIADFLAITHSDCNLHSLPDKAPPLSGQATKASYMNEAARIIALLRPQSLTH